MSTPSSTATKKPTLPPEPAQAKGTRKKKRANWRKLLFRLHGWLGLNLGLLLFVICLSGSFATLSNEIDWLLNPDQHIERPAGAPAGVAGYDWTAMHDSLRKAFPDGRNLGIYAPEARGSAALSYVETPRGQRLKVYLNPYTGAVQGRTSFFNVQRFFRSFHRRFFDGDRGITLIAFMGFPMLLLALSGFIYYRGWLKQMVTLRRDKGARIFWSDLHKGAGIWGLLFTLLIALTGIFYFVELGYIAADNYEALQAEPLPQVETASLDGYGPQPPLLPENAYAETAREALPGLQVRSMRLPRRPGGAVYVDGQRGNPLTRDRANKVHVHPFTGEVLGVQKSSELSTVPLIGDLVDPLHFGYFGGLWTKILWCLLGLMLTFSILAGTYLWVVRLGDARRASKDAPRSLRPFSWLRGAVVSVAITLAYFVVVTNATVEGIKEYAPQRPAPQAVVEVQAGPYRAQIECATPCNPAEGAALTARFRGAGMPNYQAATFDAPDRERSPDTLQGPAGAPSATVVALPGDTLQMRIKERSGATHTATFRVPSGLQAATVAEASWPRTAPGVWWVVGAFAVFTAGCLVGWLAMIARAYRAAQRKNAQ
jgi:uncharacterized iron-regulated membrane protein